MLQWDIGFSFDLEILDIINDDNNIGDYPDYLSLRFDH